MITVHDIAKMIDHSILHPTFTDNDLEAQCKIAIKYNVATVCVKPYHVKKAAELVNNCGVEVCAVIGFPHGNSTVEIKVAETLQVIKDGADEVDMVINIGKALQQDWDYIDNELKTLNDTCLSNNALLKVIFETDFVTKDSDIVKLCELCSKHKIAFVKTSTGYGFVKGVDGKYSYEGATEHVLKLMRANCNDNVQVKAAGGVRNLDQILKVKELGATRVGATATATIIDEARTKFS
ncbi:MAG: deoxyribose-phosphate aldolase [Salinivirgaceae bacterium]|jgi:deoxyribose-phosphate aldolase|nr:deoxyribose-phosphate aldolase [Salinivirgaceae bacterium]